MTRRQLRRLIRESNLIEGISDAAEVEQSLIAWDYLHDHNMPLGHGVICHVQEVVTLHQDELQPDMRGYYRDMAKVNVMVGGHDAPHYAMVPGLMGQLADRHCPRQVTGSPLG